MSDISPNFDRPRDYHDQITRSWEYLKPYRKNRVLVSTTWLLLAVPLIVKNRALLPIDFDLPFSWKILWFAALLFSVSNLIYSLRCPRIIKEFNSFPEFERTQRGLTRLNQLFIDTGLKAGVINVKRSELHTAMNELGEKFLGSGVKEGCQLSHEMTGQAELSRLSFNWVYSIANRTGYKSRWAAFLGYHTGLILVGWVAVENICHVVAYMLDGSN